jgi:hypothetical protein
VKLLDCEIRIPTDAELDEMERVMREYNALPDSEKPNLYPMTRERFEKLRAMFAKK